MEFAYEDSLDRYKMISENTSDLISTINFNAIYLYLNPAHEKILGYSSKDLLGKNCFNLVHPNDNVEKMNLGAELRLLKVLALRAGYTGLIGIMSREDEEIENRDEDNEVTYSTHNYTQNFAAGVGFDLAVPGFAKFNLDYAYSDFGVLDWVHRASLVVSF